MSHARQFGLWIAAAIGAVVLFLVILQMQYDRTQERFALSVNVRPAAGRTVFETKGCARCHGSDGAGGDSGPALRNRTSLTSLPRLVTSIWNHVPRMSLAMQSAGVPYPAMSNDESAQLLSYLFVMGLSDDSGDAVRGARVFAAKRCNACHRDGPGTPPARLLGASDSPLAFTQDLWNHAATMQSQMSARGVAWPTLDATDLRDLFAYAQTLAGPSARIAVHSADAARGWEVFQNKSCIDCHALRGRESSLPRLANSSWRPANAPALGGDSNLPPTLSQFGEAMLNHFPAMHRAMSSTGKAPPIFDANELADLAIFLYSLRNVEPAGSPHVGASVFVWRGCARCHGANAASGSAPALRGRGQTYTAVRLATGLWAHGNRMYEQSRRSGQPWPHLEESDIGDLLAFLNTPLETSHDRR